MLVQCELKSGRLYSITDGVLRWNSLNVCNEENSGELSVLTSRQKNAVRLKHDFALPRSVSKRIGTAQFRVRAHSV